MKGVGWSCSEKTGTCNGRMMKKTSGFVLGSSKSSTYPTWEKSCSDSSGWVGGNATPPVVSHLRPCWPARLSILEYEHDGNNTKPSDNLNIVIVGHVDHGKSTLLGRLYADTGSLPDGKLEKVQAICRQQGKEFEYAFLFDAFLEEQEQGITIDTARTFFGWKGRQYIIIDAPGHKEFLKNMISGAARAEGALLLIDALEGVKEQSKKHGYLLSLLGVRQFAVVVNKMDLVGYRQDVFDGIEKEYREFLGQFKAVPQQIIPVSAKLGDNIANRSRADALV